jgi:hypothetical protein
VISSKTLDSPVAKWALRGGAAILTWALTAILWPSTSGWISSRADQNQVTTLQSRIEVLEKAREINYARLYTSDSLKLTDSEQIQWLIVKMDSIQSDLNREVGERLYLEVLVTHSNPRSLQARKLAAAAKQDFESLLDKGLDANSAALKAMHNARE